MQSYAIIRRWHQGHTISGTARALSLDRKTVRGYIKQARDAGLSRDRPLDEEPKVLAALQRLVPAAEPPRPAAEQFAPHREEILLLLDDPRSEEHTSELQSRGHLVCRLLLDTRHQNRLPRY